MNPLPETILQFGAGRFLRAFADLFVHQANEQGQAVGRIVVVQSTGDDRACALNRQGGHYHVVLRGLEDGQVVDRVESVSSISRALVASSQWEVIREVAQSPHLKIVLSNTTEAGYELDPGDQSADAPPRAFPAKLLVLLRNRFESGQPGLTIIPCELREHNANLLMKVVLQLAQTWELPESFRQWLQVDCVWLNTLVDRIVTGTPREHPLLAEDAMLTVGEPYALWAIEDKPKAGRFLTHPAVTWTADVQPFFLRKVRILNGAHTALVIKALPRGFKTVREAVLNPDLGAWLERFLFEEVVPTLEGRVESPRDFARQVLERFRNPFLEHKLTDIAVHHASKVQVRLIPTRDEFQTKFGRTPPLLNEVLTMKQPNAAGNLD